MPGGRKRAHSAMPDCRKKMPGVIHSGRKRAYENRLAKRKQKIAWQHSKTSKEDILRKIDSAIRSIELEKGITKSDTNLLRIELLLEALDGMIHDSRSIDEQAELRRRKTKLHSEFQRQMEARDSAIKYAAEKARRK